MIYSMFAMIILTFVVAGYLLKLRIDAVKTGTLKLSVFRLNNSTEIPTAMLQTSRNYSNLFEMPTFFYIAGILAIILHVQTPAIILLSWLFVFLRTIHSWIHITSNNVIRRFQAFVMSNICILLMWMVLVWEYSANQTY